MRVVGFVTADPLVVVLELLVPADDEDRRRRGQPVGDRVEDRHEVGSDDEHLRFGVVDDVFDLRWRQPPVDVDAYGVGEGGAVEDLEVLDAVLVQERDAILVADACGGESGGHAAGPLVQLGPRHRAVAEHERDAVAALGSVRRAGCPPGC